MEKEFFDEIVVVKRSGQRVGFSDTKVALAIKKGFDSVYEEYDEKEVNKVKEKVAIKNDSLKDAIDESKYIAVFVYEEAVLFISSDFFSCCELEVDRVCTSYILVNRVEERRFGINNCISSTKTVW